jgi:hypothetical protein
MNGQGRLAAAATPFFLFFVANGDLVTQVLDVGVNGL